MQFGESQQIMDIFSFFFFFFFIFAEIVLTIRRTNVFILKT